MREPYATTLESDIVKQLKQQALDEGKRANDIIEKALEEYFKKEKGE